MSDLVKLTINGKEVEVEKGTNLIEAARQVDVEIPHFCYHPALPVVAVCRQCLVEVEGWPKLVPGCQTPVQEGMVVKTDSEKARDAQRQQLEFTLLNHPVDCPICDQVGECDLQRLYFDYDFQPARHDLPKMTGLKAAPIGPRVTYDEERCILCWRCIRVCDEVARTHQLDLKERGFHTVIATAPGQRLDNPYSLCTVDLCPVGALTETEFRFNVRAYRLSSVDSICAGCATGCHIELHTYGGTIRRTKPRFSAEVNRYWMCDDGRYVYQDYTTRDRLGEARVDGKRTSLKKAVAEAGRILGDVAPDSVIVLVSAQMATETLFAVRRLVDRADGAQVFATGRPDWEGDDILRSADRNPNSAGLKLIFGDRLASPADLEQRLSSGTVKLALCIDEKTTNPEIAERVDKVVVLAHRDGGIVKRADVVLPLAAWTEIDGTFVNRDGRVGRFHPAVLPPGDALPGWALVADVAAAAGRLLELGETAGAIYEAASKACGEEKLPLEAFGPTRPPVLLRFANGRG